MHCLNCGKAIEVIIFRDSDYCSDQCRKAAGADVSSVGTYMFVTEKEKHQIKEARNG